MAEIVANFELENNEISADMELSNDSNIEADFVIYSTGTTWGNISGDITNQTDLNNALSTLQTTIQNEATTRANKDSLLDNDINTINGKINTINGTLDGLGDIVTHNVNEFATASQGQLAESSLQSGDNISELVNDSGYITNNALSGYATESWVIGQGYTTNEGTVTSVNNVFPDSNGNVTILLPDTQVQADWNESDSTSKAYIKNKPSIPSSASDVGALPDSTKYGKSIDLTLNTTDYKLTISLKDQDGTVLNSKVVDFPLESVVVSGAYDSVNKKVILTLQNGSTIDFSVADLISGLQTEITSSNKLDSDLVDDTNQTHKFVTTSEKQIWNNKQDNISDLSTIRSGASAGATAVQPSDLSTVATSGSYNDLSDKPTIPSAQIQSDWNQSNNTAVDYIKNKPTIPTVPTNVSAFNNDSGYITSADLSGYATESWVGQQGYITGIDSTDVTTALGYTPYNSSNPNGYTSNVGTVTSVNNNLPDSNGNVTIASATVDQTYDGTSANAQSGVAIAGAGFLTGITSSDVTTALGYTPYNSTNPNGYITLNDVPTEVFIAEYGVTSFSDIQTAYNAGKAVFCKGNNFTYLFSLNSSLATFFSFGASANALIFKCTSSSVWSYETYYAEQTSNKVTSISSSSTNTQYPSAKLLYDQLATKQDALGYIPYNSSNPNGYTSNVGTVTSVNNTQPDSNGNVSLTIPDVDEYTSAEVQTLWSSI